MADEDFNSALKESVKYIDDIKAPLNRQFSSQINASDSIEHFTTSVKQHYNNFLLFHTLNTSGKEEVKEFYQNVSQEFKTLANDLSMNQQQKTEIISQLSNNLNLAFTQSSVSIKGLEKAQEFSSLVVETKKIISEHANENHRDVVNDLVTQEPNHLQKKAKYLEKINDLREDNTDNKLDKIANLNTKLQKDLNLNDRQINELNIGVGHYINSNKNAFKADLEKLQDKNKDNISREDITKYLDAKTAEISAKKSQTSVQKAKNVVTGAHKSATQSNPNNKETKSKKNTVSSIVKNIPKTLKKAATNPTKLERDYHNAVKEIERDVKVQAAKLKKDLGTRLSNAKSTVSHTIPPGAKEYAEKLGHDALGKANAAVELAKEGKNRIQKIVQNKTSGWSH